VKSSLRYRGWPRFRPPTRGCVRAHVATDERTNEPTRDPLVRALRGAVISRPRDYLFIDPAPRALDRPDFVYLPTLRISTPHPPWPSLSLTLSLWRRKIAQRRLRVYNWRFRTSRLRRQSMSFSGSVGKLAEPRYS
jgi:hypothetical protein